MTQGELEKLALKTGNLFAELEIRIMSDIARRIHDNGFSTASADWQMTRLQQLGMAESEIKGWIKETLQKTDAEMEYIFSDEVYKQYYQHARAYKVSGMQQIQFERNTPLQQLTQAVKKQLSGEYENLAASMGFAIRGPDGRIQYSPLMEFYRSTLDNAVLDIQSGSFSYETVLQRTVSRMTASGVRWVDYDSGVHNRIDVAARRAVLTGFRQVQALINEQTAADLGTDSYEVSYHVGARPSHQPWEGRVWTKEELVSVCGLGDVTGLCGANCYHDYLPFIPGVSVRTYTDEQLQEMIVEENTPKEYYGKQYTTYEALQEQRRREREIRATRQQVRLLQEGGADEKTIILKKARYQGQLQNYVDFSRKMGLPEQKQRILQDGLRGNLTPTKAEMAQMVAKDQEKENIRERRGRNTQFAQRFEEYNLGVKDTITIRKLMNNLNKTEIGREIVEYIVNHPEIRISMYYGVDNEWGLKGAQEKNEITIYASETKNVQETAEVLIHEITHYRYNIGGSRWAECVCFAQEVKHRTGKSKLTGSELRNIIKTVAELYPELPWRNKK